MIMSHQPKPIYESYRLDAAERLLSRDGEVVPLQPKIFDLLLVMVERHGRLLEKDELMKAVWPDTVVEEVNLANNISILRKTIGENGRQFIETAPKRGYRFVAEVREVGSDGFTPAAHLPVAAEEKVKNVEEAVVGQKRASWRNMAISAGAALLCVAAWGYFGLGRKVEKAAPESIRSVAVLPFKLLNRSQDDEYLGIGLADAVITRLSGAGKIIVRPTGSVSKYTASTQDPILAGREQQVDAVLDASLWRSGERVRVTARLLDAKDGSLIWSYQSDEHFTDVFTAQDIISEKITKALALKLTGVEQTRLAKRYTENTKAHDVYARARYFWNRRNREDFEKAIGYFNQAIEIDPEYALAYAGLADCYLSMTTYGMFPTAEEGFSKTKEAAKKALAIDDTLAEAHTTLAHLTWIHEWNWDEGERGFKRAIELNQNYSTAHQWYAIYLTSMARHEEAIAEITRAQELDPISIIIGLDMARTFYFARHYDMAIEQCLRALEMDPGFYRIIGDWLEMAYDRKGLYNEALEAQLKAMAARGARPETISALKAVFAVSGWKGYLRKQIELMKAEAGNRPLPTYSMARLYARLGDNNQAIEWLHKAYDEHSNYLVFLKVDPMFDGLRADRRFADLLRKVGLPQ
jgi:DNA-binding winged helix-turn-helix (wHTH) protein/TolB-like protein/Tfp pilus assembly protein PilF